MECPFCSAQYNGGTCAACGTAIPRNAPHQSRRAVGLRRASRKDNIGWPLERSKVPLNEFWQDQQRLIDQEKRILGEECD